jgi:hypothetical protein
MKNSVVQGLTNVSGSSLPPPFKISHESSPRTNLETKKLAAVNEEL